MARTKGATHEDLSRRTAAAGPSNRSFGIQVGSLLFVVGALLLGLYRWRRGAWVSESGWGPWPWWLIGAALLLVVLAFAAPRILTPVNRAWMWVALAVHTILSPVVMFLLWALVMTPMGWIVRLLGKDLLRMKIDPSATSYWIVRDPPGPEPATMRNQF